MARETFLNQYKTTLFDGNINQIKISTAVAINKQFGGTLEIGE